MSTKRFPELRPRLWDAGVVLTVAVLAAVSALTMWGGTKSHGPLTAEVTLADDSTLSIPLTGATQQVLHSNGYTLTLTATETEVWISQSDCPTQDCVHTGRISRSGQSIVCLPARVSVRLTGGQPQGPDLVIG